MNYIDISWPISNDMTTYKDKKDICIKQTKTFNENNVRESQICMSMHTGTHIDAPAHFLQNGETADFISLDQLNGECQVLDLTYAENKITAQDLAKFKIIKEILLLKTKNSYLKYYDPFDINFVYLDSTAANYIISNFPTLKCIGIDYLGIEREQPTHLTHTTFFESGIVILEGIRLQNVEPGDYILNCLPLAIKNSEAIPARAILSKK